jgi:hypothetical protein
MPLTKYNNNQTVHLAVCHHHVGQLQLVHAQRSLVAAGWGGKAGQGRAGHACMQVGQMRHVDRVKRQPEKAVCKPEWTRCMQPAACGAGSTRFSLRSAWSLLRRLLTVCRLE